MSTDTGVLVVGAGPTGLTLACDLVRRGITCRIIDRSPGPREGSRGFGVKPRTLAVFDALGIADTVIQAARADTHLRVYLGTDPIYTGRSEPAAPTADTPYPGPVSLPQSRTEAILRARLAELGESVRFGSCLTGLDQDADGVTATIATDGEEETLRAAYLVGCDGGGSTVRKLLGIGFPGRTEEDMRALLADVEVHGLEPRDAVHLWLGARRMMAVRPWPGAATSQVVTSIAPGRTVEPSVGELTRLVAEQSGRDDIRLGTPTWLSVWRYNLRLADRYRSGRAFLAGDAAHVHSPFGAYGMNTGIQDAYNLGWKLDLAVRDRAAPGLLDTYEAERRPAGQAALDASDRGLSSAVTPPRVLRPVVRHLIGPLLSRMRAGGRDDHPTYHDGPLSVQASRRTRVRAGDPAPDGVLTTPRGDRIHLYDLYRAPGFTSLSFDRERQVYVTTPPAYTRGTGHDDPDGTVRGAFGVRPGTTVVIRPDGYIGLIAPTSGPELPAYLSRVLR
ncbi:FAD-dependent monooxygenase [Actinoallomurus sp. NBC_01490]|uniref:FAD-dependent monooxygenase n=1 Tax=Actinoallomurus sp. NBC_01490 TaxID=2903557 RepID=UPI002E321F3F|nr:FAD-dependent monooxygenase [Actinoallomurus sp. NBC_01490]